MLNISSSKLGWLQAFLNVMIFWGVSNIFISYSTQILEVNKVIFALATYASCSFCLLAYAGHGKLSKETMRSVDTWGYGIIMLINYFVTINLFSLTSATEASLIQRFSVVFSVFISWFFLMRTPNKYQLVGVAAIFACVLYIVHSSPDDKIFYLYIMIFLSGIFQSLRIFIAELHRPNKQAAKETGIKTRCRVIGYVMFVITLIFGSLVVFASLMHNYIPQEYQANFVVKVNDLFSYQSILAGFIMGIFIYTPIRFLEFSASEKIKTENYLAVTALSFFSTMFWEWSTSSVTGLSLAEFTTQEFIAGVIITLAALVMSLSKIFTKEKPSNVDQFIKIETQNIIDVTETREVIANTMQHFETSVSKTAKALDLPENVIHAILDDNKKVLAFTEKTMKVVARNYRKNIANSDALTGLLNRSAFITALKTASFEAEKLSLFFIDLNKFKPVNDTFGHKVGDMVLQKTAKRLRELFPEKSLITRLGGDEYCILLLNEDKQSAISKIDIITQALEKDIKHEDNTINISGSIGLACYPEDTTNPEELIELADKQMYVQKSER